MGLIENDEMTGVWNDRERKTVGLSISFQQAHGQDSIKATRNRQFPSVPGADP
jgi:hypothetical protein